jgi:hypothetical protein
MKKTLATLTILLITSHSFAQGLVCRDKTPFDYDGITVYLDNDFRYITILDNSDDLEMLISYQVVKKDNEFISIKGEEQGLVYGAFSFEVVRDNSGTIKTLKGLQGHSLGSTISQRDLACAE